LPEALVRLHHVDPPLAAELAALFMAARAEAMPWLPVCHGLEATTRFLADLVAQLTAWLAHDGTGRVAGFILADDDWIHHLYVAPGRQGKGIGRRLLRQVLADGRPRQLWCFADNLRARRFYEAAGFMLVERTDGRHNEEGCPDVRYHYAGTRSA